MDLQKIDDQEMNLKLSLYKSDLTGTKLIDWSTYDLTETL